jgi:hypothetical protein
MSVPFPSSDMVGSTPQRRGASIGLEEIVFVIFVTFCENDPSPKVQFNQFAHSL